MRIHVPDAKEQAVMLVLIVLSVRIKVLVVRSVRFLVEPVGIAIIVRLVLDFMPL